ncbi:non-specific serine/threonine protein kinase [Crossiella equi]|uniref:Non-specific serine/threonine protein kinase n=2 Tax=Crossiella equi TaxID=130796 RepID=A0ABS5A7A8_9PSEU|nr:LuxR C-terminal-related transcriptional regulator [Crossiella equi]MBP2472152.1 non-specific serine/threonine protein kinase [Crossiella equi]
MLVDRRLVTLTGPGGVGKTRLAQRVAAERSGAFADGARFVALDSLREPDLLPQVVAKELGLVNMPEDATGGVAAFLADKALLLVLDNCEHLVEASGEFVAEVLAAAPDVHVLATSRQVLGLDGENVFSIGPLPVPRVVDGELRGGVDAVTLFADRAGMAVSNFEVTEANRAEVVRICRLLDGLPLAIELTAAWLRVLPLSDLLVRLENRFSLPAQGKTAKPGKHRTLTAMTDWSFQLCSAGEQLLWARLSVFEGGFTLAAVEAVCADERVERAEVLGLLAGLVDKSVVIRDDRDGSPRYRMLELTRQFGGDQLAGTGGLEEFRARHCGYFHDCSEAVAEAWYTSRQLDLAAELRSEHANLRAALEYGFSEPGGLMGARMASNLFSYWRSCGFLGEGRRWLNRALAQEGLPDDLRISLLGSTATVAAVLGDLADALKLCEAAVALARTHGDDQLLGKALVAEGRTRLLDGDLERTESAYQEAIVRYEGLASPSGDYCPPYIGPAIVAMLRGDSPRAESYARRLVEVSIELGEFAVRAYGHFVLAASSWQRKDLRSTLDHAAECVRHSVALREPVGLCFVAETLAEVAVATGELPRAARILGLVEKLWTRIGTVFLTGNPLLLEPRREREAVLLSALGMERFVAAHEEGAAHGESMEKAAEFLLDGQDRGTGPLTRRQVEVARLVAGGKTNKEIASELSISPRTVAVHIDHILRKLGFSSRVQIGVWFASRG